MKRERAMLILRLTLGGLLAWTGATKFGMGHSFSSLIANYDLLPAVPSQMLGVILPWIEFVTGALLLLGLWIRPTAFAAVALAIAFFLAVSSALFRGLDIPCGCFGGLWIAKVGWGMLALDIAILAAAAVLAVTTPRARRDALTKGI